MEIQDLLKHLEDGTVANQELTTLYALVQRKQPQFILELGTFTGLSTLAMAMAAPAAHIHTVDIDNREVPERADGRDMFYIRRKRLGEQFKNTEYAQRITQYLCDTTKFEPPIHYDFIFVDAAHSDYYVRQDTANAFRWLHIGGTIVWHDYDCCWPAVTQCINDYKAKGYKFTHPPYTTFAVYEWGEPH